MESVKIYEMETKTKIFCVDCLICGQIEAMDYPLLLLELFTSECIRSLPYSVYRL